MPQQSVNRREAGCPVSVAIQDARESDMDDVQRIYSSYVLQGLSTFEETPPKTQELLARRQAIVDAGLPYLIATVNSQVVGYAYAAFYRTRPAYRFTVEDSVYVAQDFQTRGAGTALLRELIARCSKADYQQMVAVIGDSANAASIALHSRLGFRQVGTLRAVGYKLGRWVDTVLMQRVLSDVSPVPKME